MVFPHSFPPQACNLLAAKHSSLAMINTSQNLGHISVLECASEELFCLTPLGWIQGMAWGVSPGVSKHVSNFMGSEATRQIFGDGPGSLLAGAWNYVAHGTARAPSQLERLQWKCSLPTCIGYVSLLWNNGTLDTSTLNSVCFSPRYCILCVAIPLPSELFYLAFAQRCLHVALRNFPGPEQI